MESKQALLCEYLASAGSFCLPLISTEYTPLFIHKSLQRRAFGHNPQTRQTRNTLSSAISQSTAAPEADAFEISGRRPSNQKSDGLATPGPQDRPAIAAGYRRRLIIQHRRFPAIQKSKPKVAVSFVKQRRRNISGQALASLAPTPRAPRQRPSPPPCAL